MSRVPETRAPAQPSTPRQHERYGRILRAAVRQTEKSGIDQIQMADVAKDAEVALATLYRYFPSKSVLFNAVMRDQVERLLEARPWTVGADRIGAVSDVLVLVGEEMLARPELSRAMIRSNNELAADSNSKVTVVFKELMRSASGVEELTEEEGRLLRIVEQAWYGIFQSGLNGVITPEQMAADTRLAVRLLLSDVW